MSDIQLSEKNGDLIVTTPKLTLTIEPVPAKLGAKMLAHLLQVSLYGGAGLSEDDVLDMYKHALGSTNLDSAENTLRHQVYNRMINAVLWWQVTGLREAEAFLADGMRAALEIHFGRSGLSLSEILSLSESVNPTQEQADTPDTTIPTGSKNESKTAESQPRKRKPAVSAGKRSSKTGQPSNATSTSTTESTGTTKNT